MREIIASPIFLYLLINVMGSWFEYVLMNEEEKEALYKLIETSYNNMITNFSNIQWVTIELYSSIWCLTNFIAWLPIKLVTLIFLN